MVTRAEIKGAFGTIERFCKERGAMNEEIARLLAILKGVCAIIADEESAPETADEPHLEAERDYRKAEGEPIYGESLKNE